MSVGEQIKDLRMQLGEVLNEKISQRVLGNMLGGISGQTIFNYENGNSAPPSYLIPYLNSLSSDLILRG